MAVHQLRFKLQHELFDHLQNDIFRQGRKADHRIQTVAEFGFERALDGSGVFAFAAIAAKADC
jgi:hypothetical protein